MITTRTKILLGLAAVCTAAAIYVEWTKATVCPATGDESGQVMVAPHLVNAEYVGWPKWPGRPVGDCVPATDVDGNANPALDDTGLYLSFVALALWAMGLVSLQADLGYWWKKTKQKRKRRQRRSSREAEAVLAQTAAPRESVESSGTPNDGLQQ